MTHATGTTPVEAVVIENPAGEGDAVIVSLPDAGETGETPAAENSERVALAEIEAETAVELAEIHSETEIAVSEIRAEQGNEQWQEAITPLKAQVEALGETVLAMATVIEGLAASTPQTSPEAGAADPLGTVDPTTVSSETTPEPSSTEPTESPSESRDGNREPEATPESPPVPRRRARMI